MVIQKGGKMVFKELDGKIAQGKAKIGIIGQGYVGLPLAVEFANAGFSVTGFEVDDKKVKSINRGVSYIGDVSSAVLSDLVKRKMLSASGDFSQLKKQDVIIVCVPTPLRKSKDPDVSYIISSTDSIQKNLRKGQLVILESTTYPGTTRELVLPMLEETGLSCGKDFFLAFSPERVDPSNAKFNISNTPKVVGGITKESGMLAKAIYGKITNPIVHVSSAEAAEMVKLLENTFRAVNIALVNEVALMCDRLKLDSWEIIDAAASKPFGFMPFYPGPGIGGHCIPLDPHYLSWKLKTLNFYSRFIELAGEMNSRMPEYLVQKIVDVLNEKGKTICKAKILLLGVAYKKDVSDIRESPALDVLKLLLDRKADVNYYDPFIPEFKWEHGSFASEKNLEKLKKYDAVVIITNHTNVNYDSVVHNAQLVIDSRNATKGIQSSKVVKL
jgi:UDP-N-acetyl-D-glucosamine dehydrogenase